jgi:hypothetical protein
LSNSKKLKIWLYNSLSLVQPKNAQGDIFSKGLPVRSLTEKEVREWTHPHLNKFYKDSNFSSPEKTA